MAHRRWLPAAVVCLAGLMASCTAAPSPGPTADGFRTLAVEDYRAKMTAGWLGQMLGVGYGASTEFGYLGRIVPEGEVPRFSTAMVNDSFNQDDLYVELTFLETLIEHGLDVAPEQAGVDFANSTYELWHGNLAARTNLRAGVAPPDSGHPTHSGHSDDIDYQIEADFAGLISPGLPNRAIALGDTFGRLVAYGDGLYGGLFMSCMYGEAFFETEPLALVEAGLACIPAGSQYAEAVTDVVGWWGEHPDDWQATWQLVDDKYRLDPAYRRSSCTVAEEAFNIDAKINGAYVVMGLLYGRGEPLPTMQVALRSGQDSDCNPASANGVLMTSRGLDREARELLTVLDREKTWSGSQYTFDTLVEDTEELARQSVLAAGGRIETDASGREYFLIPEQEPEPGALEQSWEAAPPEGAVFSDEARDQIEVRPRRRG